MLTSLFDYPLPENRIAQKSIEPRDHSRLLVVDRTSDALQDAFFYDLPSYLNSGDLLIFNNSKVFKARLRAKKGEKEIEIFLLRPETECVWLALAKPAKKLSVNDVLTFKEDMTACVIKKKDDGTIHLSFPISDDGVFTFTDRVGEVPIPPYVHAPKELDQYQTVYAKERGSVAAPTAGFHFTEQLFEKLRQKGVQIAFITLHVGLGTFRPMKTETVEEHVMHEEWIDVPEDTMRVIQETKANGGRIIAVGTTAVRALESAAFNSSKFTNLFITPGYSFQVIDGIITNFHLPKSTLLVLISAFAGRERVMQAYHYAIEHGYRFYSFGDGMIIV